MILPQHIRDCFGHRPIHREVEFLRDWALNLARTYYRIAREERRLAWESGGPVLRGRWLDFSRRLRHSANAWREVTKITDHILMSHEWEHAPF